MHMFIKEDEQADYFLHKPVSHTEIDSLMTLLNI